MPADRAGLERAETGPWIRALHLLYDGLFVLFLVLSSPYFLIRSLRDPRLLRSIPGRFGFGVKRPGGAASVWIHGVSVGEIKAIPSLLQGLKERLPGLDLVVSSTTPAGYELARNLMAGHLVVQFPLDLSWIVRRVIRRLRPSLIVLMELEIWPNLLSESAKLGIPVLVVNGRISERSFGGYRRFRRLLPEFRLIRTYAVQSAIYADRLRQLGVPEAQIQVTGNVKYDNLRTRGDKQALEALRRELMLSADQRVVVAGSTHPGEEEIVLAAFARLEQRIPLVRLVLVPRHVERGAELARLVERQGRESVVLTEVRAGRRLPTETSVVVVNTIGELESFYGLASVVFVGGSLVKTGGHNVLEPAALGRPVLFGPHMGNFREEERLLLDENAAVRVHSADELAQEMIRVLEEPEEARNLGRKAQAAVNTRRGATERNLDLILSILGDHGPPTAGTTTTEARTTANP